MTGPAGIARQADPSPLLAPDPGGFVARTLVLDPADDGMDPVAVATVDPEGFLLQGPLGSLAAVGVAARLVLPHGLLPEAASAVTAWLAAVEAVDPLRRPASGVVAVAAFPFAPGEPAELVVPSVVVVRTGTGDAWATVVAPAPSTPSDAADAVTRLRAATSTPSGSAGASGPAVHDGRPVSLQLWPDGPGFEEAVERALAAIARHRISKVVLARQVEATFQRPIDQAAVLRRLRRLEPSCAVFAHRRGGRSFLGASPELLVRRRGDVVVSHPLAGTSPRDADAPALLASTKERAEHQAAAAAVAERLAPWCASLDVPGQPGLVHLSSVVHLGTRMVGRLRPTGGQRPVVPDALTMAAVLHPTPAVAGVPTGEALAVIAELEPHGRGRYAGPVGWADARGDGDLVVGIRSATVDGAHAVAFAGAGIVAGSDPRRELDETTLKLRTALAALGLPTDVPVTRSAVATG